MRKEDEVQLLVMLRLRDRGIVDAAAVKALIERASPLTSATLERIAASQGGMFVTNAGLRWLAHAE